ncbi:hypothetical protein Tco_0241692 [Tanacetum coccineum]
MAAKAQKRGFSASLAGRKPRVQIEGNSVRTDSSTEAMVDDMLVAGSDMAELNKPKGKLPLVFEMKDRCSKNSIHLVKNLKVCSWAKLVRILISEGSLSLLKILRTKSLAEMFTKLVMKEKLKL